jgi:hypothetical protein
MPTLPRRVTGALAILAATLLVLAAALTYVKHAFFDADQFSARATAALRDDRARDVVADRLTVELLRAKPDLLAARPLITSATGSLIGSRPLLGLFRAGARDVHRAVFEGDEDTITLTLADAGTVVADAIEPLRPSLAARIPRGRDVVLVRERLGNVGAGAARIAAKTRVAAIVLTVLGLLLAAAAVLTAAERRRAVLVLGAGLAVAGAVLAAATIAGRAMLLDRVDPPDRDAAAAVWDAFGAGLTRLGWALALLGAIAYAAGRSILSPGRARDTGRRLLARVSREPATGAGRVVRVVLFFAAGLLLLADPAASLRVIASLGGVVLATVGLTALLDLLGPPPGRPAAVPARPRRLLAAVVAAALVAVLVFGFLHSDEVTRAAPSLGKGCNGSPELCDRTLPEVALLASHNSMSIPARHWFAAEQDGTIAEQLDHGVRGLLIDTYYADELPNGRVRTVIPKGGSVEDAIGPTGRRAAERLRERAGFRGKGERGLWLCHTFCEVGATRLSEALDDVASFLVDHPNDVVVIVNQDAISPESFVGAMRRAGLDDLALTPPKPGGRWPTLREMIDENRRLLVMAENRGGAAPWYQPAYRGLVEETPYDFRSVRALSDPATRERTCRAYRGGTGASLFLMNHWVSTDPTPRPTDAARVNAPKVLGARADACRRIRRHLPNLVAVNFARRGDPRATVDRLNGLR